MRRGAIAMLDALGFKGIWSRHSPEAVLNKMKHMQAETQRSCAGLNERVRRLVERGLATNLVVVTAESVFLSDTVVIAITYDDASLEPTRSAWALVLLSTIVGELLCDACRSEPPFAYRGCFTVGEFEMDGTFIVGPAVDAVASHIDTCDAALVWGLPNANEELKKAGFGKRRTSWFAESEVPIKNGSSYRAFCINMLSERDANTRRLLLARVRQSFGASPDLAVDVKRQNTMRFLLQQDKRMRLNEAQALLKRSASPASAKKD